MCWLAKLCERLGYHSVWGNDDITTQDYVRELFPGKPPSFYEIFHRAVLLCGGDNKPEGWHGRRGLYRCAIRSGSPSRLQPSTRCRMAGSFLALASASIREEFTAWAPRLKKDARRGDMLDEGLALMQRLFAEQRVTHDGKYYACRNIEMFPKPKQNPFALWIGGHNMENVERAARVGTGWLPGWRPWPELAERIKVLRQRAAALGRDPSVIEIAPQFSMTIAKTAEEAERRYMASGLVAHRKSLAYTGRDLSKQVVANLVGSPDMIREKVAGLAAIGVDHACALMIPADSISEFEEQVQWFAETIYRQAGTGA